MNYPHNLKSPRGSMIASSIINQNFDSAQMQQSLLQKDQTILSLQATINKLQLKSKEYLTYEQAMIQYQAKAEDAENEIVKINEKLRGKISECQQLKKKLDQQLKQKKDRAGSFVRQEDYNRLLKEFKKFKEVHRNCENFLTQKRKEMSAYEKQIGGLEEEIKSLNSVIQNKNSQINELKVEKYSLRSNTSIQSQRDLNNKLKSSMIGIKIGGQTKQNLGSVSQIQKINYELLSYTRQNDQLRQKCQRLEHQLQIFKTKPQASSEMKSSEYVRIIGEYESSLSSMANKLGVVHKLELENNRIEQEKHKMSIEAEQLKQELASRVSYCQSLEKKIRELQNYRGKSVQAQMQNFITRNYKLQKEIEKLQAILSNKIEEMGQLKKSYETLQVSEQTFRLITLNLSTLQSSLNAGKEEMKKTQDQLMNKQQEIFKIQKQYKRLQIQLSQVKAEMSKANRTLSQKVQKIQFQSAEIKRLTKQNQEKNQLSKKLAKLQVEHNNLNSKFESQLHQSNELAMSLIIMSAEIERRVSTGSISKQFITQYEILKAKSKQTQIHSKMLEERVRRLENLHKKVVAQSMKVSEHLQASHKRWNHYDVSMQKLLNFLQSTNQRNNKKYEEMDSNINTLLQLQKVRLMELAKMDTFGDAKNQSEYIRYRERVNVKAEVVDEKEQQKQ